MRYEHQLPADLEGQAYEGCVLAVGPYRPPAMLIKHFSRGYYRAINYKYIVKYRTSQSPLCNTA